MQAVYRHFGCRITDDLLYKGMRTLFMENEVIRVGLLLDKGADIFQWIYKPTDTDFLWRSPNGLARPDRFTPTTASSSGAFLDSYHGGWQEIFPGGGPVEYHGAELGLHGEVTSLGWDAEILEDSPERIVVRLAVRCVRTPFRLERTLRIEKGLPALFIDEALTNLSPEPQEFMWGHHPAFGAPFLHEGVRLFVPAAKAQAHSPQFLPSSRLQPGQEFSWPLASVDGQPLDLSVVQGPQGGFGELIYLKELSAGWYALLDPQKQIGFGLAWQKEVFPYLWFWLVYGKAPGYPWYDRAYVVALEPWTGIPNNLNQAIQLGNQTQLKGGETIRVSLTATAITGRNTVRQIDLDGSIA